MQHLVARKPKSAAAEIDVEQPLSGPVAKRLIREILGKGTYSFTTHAQEEMAKDGLDHADCVAVLRAHKGIDAPELLSGSYRYRVRTDRMIVVVAFRSETNFVVVTAWRIKQ